MPNDLPELPTEPNPWKIHASSMEFDNPWVQVIKHEVTRPSGNPGLYTIVSFKKRAVGIIPVDSAGYTWLVGQFRFPTNTYEWEIPEGGAEPGEALLECAQRELQEEAGLTAKTWTPILELQLSNSITNELAYFFLAQDLAETTAMPEETERIAIRKIPLGQAFNLALHGHLRDAMTVAALLKLKCMIDAGILTVPVAEQ